MSLDEPNSCGNFFDETIIEELRFGGIVRRDVRGKEKCELLN